jgi:hypothetical protein
MEFGSVRANLVPRHQPERRRWTNVHRNRLQSNLVFNEERSQETAMHWRKVPGKTNGKAFYIVVSVLLASVALTTTLLALHFHT